MQGAFFSHTRRLRQCLPSAALLAVLLPLVGTVAAAPVHAAPSSPAALRGPRPPQPGDVLAIFDNARVYVITNDAAELADALLEGCRHKERRVLTVEEWAQTPRDVRLYVSTVFLINRERLPEGQRVPEKCQAAGDELHTEVVRGGRQGGVTHEVTLSAPDSAWLRRAVQDFRRLPVAPRSATRKNVRSLAVVAFGEGAKNAAGPLLEDSLTDKNRAAHLLPHEAWVLGKSRVDDMDEVLLIDRGSPEAASLPEGIRAKLTASHLGPHDTVGWRETKDTGRSRVLLCGPSPDHLAYVTRRFAEGALKVGEAVTVLHTARDLRSVRRVAVAALKSPDVDGQLARRLASRAATELRTLDTFEVLERAGLNEVLSEVALQQAGLTKSRNRARVRQMAAADALLIVEVTSGTGRTEYEATYERLTPRMGGAPRRPAEPSRLKHSVSLPGKENDPVARSITDALLSRAVGTKTDREYKELLNHFNLVTLPLWQRQVDSYHEERRTRPVSWKQNLTARRSATVSGSLRLVDLMDGLVLWEAPFAVTERLDDATLSPRTVTTYGEDSRPQDTDLPDPQDETTEELLNRASEMALAQGFTALKGTALLPAPASLAVASAATSPVSPETQPTPVGDGPTLPAPPATAGRVLDVDGDQVLIGLGQVDGLRVGDRVLVTLPDGRTTVALVANRVRPRTCDAIFEKSVSAGLRAKVVVGLAALRAASVVKEAQK